MGGPYERTPAYYLTSLFEIEEPEKYGCLIGTLNHDDSVEQIAFTLKIELYNILHALQEPKNVESDEPYVGSMIEEYLDLLETTY